MANPFGNYFAPAGSFIPEPMDDFDYGDYDYDAETYDTDTSYVNVDNDRDELFTIIAPVGVSFTFTVNA